MDGERSALDPPVADFHFQSELGGEIAFERAGVRVLGGGLARAGG